MSLQFSDSLSCLVYYVFYHDLFEYLQANQLLLLKRNDCWRKLKTDRYRSRV